MKTLANDVGNFEGLVRDNGFCIELGLDNMPVATHTVQSLLDYDCNKSDDWIFIGRRLYREKKESTSLPGSPKEAARLAIAAFEALKGSGYFLKLPFELLYKPKHLHRNDQWFPG